ncbi:Squalene/oxidosqualene cyclase [Planctomycetales bacterium 10988]|nr:Squalene/oxidosqualene cyclase [Planctomycetales bacterium 10988]
MIGLLSQRWTRRVLVLLLLGSMPLAEGNAEISALEARRAIALGIRYLKDAQLSNGSWPNGFGFDGGVTAICTLSLLNAGVSQQDPAIKRAMGYLRKFPPRRTYVVALQTMVFCYVKDEEDTERIKQNVDWLVQTQLKDGTWSYMDNQAERGDHSNSQFALLALHEAERYSPEFNIPDEVFVRAQEAWQAVQNSDGSWGYHRQDRTASGSMTAAGISSLLISDTERQIRSLLTKGGLSCCEPSRPNPSLERGLQWLEKRFSVSKNPGSNSPLYLWYYYYLYGLERAARLTGKRFLDDHDWYREGTEALVNLQRKPGDWKISSTESRLSWTGSREVCAALALLFLAKGRRPVLMAKLQHSQGDDWNRHPTAVAEITYTIESAWKRQLTWQTIELRSTALPVVKDIPILFLSGRDAPQLTNDEVELLRKYLEQGGFLFAERNCESTLFEAGIHRLVRRMFPNSSVELEPLPPEHPVWRQEKLINARYFGTLHGLNVGCRTAMIYSDWDLTCRWQYGHPRLFKRLNPVLQQEVENAQAIGQNIFSYVTDRELKYKYEFFQEEQPPLEVDRAVFRIAMIEQRGSLNSTPAAIPNLQRMLNRFKGMEVGFAPRQFSLANEGIFDFPVLYMHGRESFSLTSRDRQQLKLYLERGGVLVADSICGSQEFAEAFRSEINQLFPEKVLEPIPVGHELFTRKFGGYELQHVKLRTRRPTANGSLATLEEERTSPKMEGLPLGNRYAVIFSPFDISCALQDTNANDCEGYDRDDALRLGMNAILYALQQPGP